MRLCPDLVVIELHEATVGHSASQSAHGYAYKIRPCMDYGRHGVAIYVSGFSGYCPNFYEQANFYQNRFGSYCCVYEERYDGMWRVYGNTVNDSISLQAFRLFSSTRRIFTITTSVRHKTDESSPVWFLIQLIPSLARLVSITYIP
jgi:hypothetical protein